jgi:putative serine protease PepD
MKYRFLPLAAAALIAVGALADHMLNSGNSAPAASAPKTAPAARTAGSSNTVTTALTSSSAASVSAVAIDQATEHAYAVAGPSVVYVDSGSATGSGIIYDSSGDIVTNAHVVSGATSLSVTLSDGRKFSAQLVGTDPADDLAVIRISASGLQPATFAQAGSYHVAQTVLAIGSPLGLKGSVSSGLISGTGRVEQEPNGAYIPNAIQTSAPINPGNSGGALVSLSGVVVAIPTLEQTSASNGAAAQDIGFAVPSDRVLAVVPQIISTGKVQHTGRPYLGISPGDPSSQSSSPFGFGQGNQQTTPGAVVDQVAASGPAGKAGIQQGDTITALNGQSVSNAQDLLSLLARLKPGNTVTLKIDRNGTTSTLKVRLGELPG